MQQFFRTPRFRWHQDTSLGATEAGSERSRSPCTLWDDALGLAHRFASLVARPELRSKYRGRRARRTQRTGRRATAGIEHLGARKAHREIFSRMALERERAVQ